MRKNDQQLVNLDDFESDSKTATTSTSTSTTTASSYSGWTSYIYQPLNTLGNYLNPKTTTAPQHATPNKTILTKPNKNSFDYLIHLLNAMQWFKPQAMNNINIHQLSYPYNKFCDQVNNDKKNPLINHKAKNTWTDWSRNQKVGSKNGENSIIVNGTKFKPTRKELEDSELGLLLIWNFILTNIPKQNTTFNPAVFLYVLLEGNAEGFLNSIPTTLLELLEKHKSSMLISHEDIVQTTEIEFLRDNCYINADGHYLCPDDARFLAKDFNSIPNGSCLIKEACSLYGFSNSITPDTKQVNLLKKNEPIATFICYSLIKVKMTNDDINKRIVSVTLEKEMINFHVDIKDRGTLTHLLSPTELNQLKELMQKNLTFGYSKNLIGASNEPSLPETIINSYNSAIDSVMYSFISLFWKQKRLTGYDETATMVGPDTYFLNTDNRIPMTDKITTTLPKTPNTIHRVDIDGRNSMNTQIAMGIFSTQKIEKCEKSFQELQNEKATVTNNNNSNSNILYQNDRIFSLLDETSKQNKTQTDLSKKEDSPKNQSEDLISFY